MNTVQPIREIDKIEAMKSELLKSSYRDYLLFMCGINLGRRVGDLLSLKVCDLKGKTHLIIKEEKTGKQYHLQLMKPCKVPSIRLQAICKVMNIYSKVENFQPYKQTESIGNGTLNTRVAKK